MDHLIVDAGHGGMDPGCISKTNTREKDITLQIAARVQYWAGINKHIMYTRLTRTADQFVSLKERVLIEHSVSRKYLDPHRICFVSIHVNASLLQETARGLSVFRSEHTTPPRGIKLAQCLFDAIHARVPELPQYNAGVISDEPFIGYPLFILNKTYCPAALIEAGFLTSAEDCALLVQSDVRDRIAQGIVNGIVTYWS